jgi:thiol-disulfide isomerase/thioredoxin
MSVAEFPPESQNHVKSDGTKYQVLLGLVYADWCGHCTQLKPVWTSLFTKLKNNNEIGMFAVEDKNITLLKEKIQSIYGVQIEAEGYPTIYKIANGKVEYYNGGRTAEEIEKWAQDSNPVSKPVASESNPVLNPVPVTEHPGKRKKRKTKRSTRKNRKTKSKKTKRIKKSIDFSDFS